MIPRQRSCFCQTLSENIPNYYPEETLPKYVYTLDKETTIEWKQRADERGINGHTRRAIDRTTDGHKRGTNDWTIDGHQLMSLRNNKSRYYRIILSRCSSVWQQGLSHFLNFGHLMIIRVNLVYAS